MKSDRGMSKIHPLIKDDMDMVLDAKVAPGHMAGPSWGVRAAEQVAAADVVTVDGAVVIDPMVVNNGLRYPRFSLACIDYHGPFRQAAIRLIEWPVFDNVSMTVILFNCITLAMYDPTDAVRTAALRCVVSVRFRIARPSAVK